jgi:hypothetical protein
MNVNFKINMGEYFMIVGFIFGLIETIYFIMKDGYHFFPINHAESICDIIALFIFAIGFFKNFLLKD